MESDSLDVFCTDFDEPSSEFQVTLRIIIFQKIVFALLQDKRYISAWSLQKGHLVGND